MTTKTRYELNHVKMEKGEHTFVFLYSKRDHDNMIKEICRQAGDLDYSFSHMSALKIIYEMAQLKYQFE